MPAAHEKGLRSTNIRKQAEEALKGRTTDLKKLSSGDTRSLVHELQVHQIELEIQNEELQRAQKELEAARNRYSDLYDFAPIGYFTFDRYGLILEINLTGAQKLGRERANLIKKPFSLYIVPEFKDVFYLHLQQVFKTIKQMTCEIKLVDLDGNIFDALLESIPLHDYYDGNLMCRTAMSDITERKRIEEELKKYREHLEELVIERTREVRYAKEEAENANMAKTNFLQTMSHELRTPLNAILGFSEMLKLGTFGELNEKQEHAINNIITGSNNLNNIISQILDIVKIYEGTSEVHIEKIPVPETLGEIIGIIKEKAAKKNVLLEKNLDLELEYIEADKQKFKQVFINLLNNAVKFSKDEGGTVTINAKKEGDIARFSVSDRGIGIKEEDLEKIFQKFTQLDSGTSRKYGGTGIGLAISKQFVELHGGKIYVESKYGEGSTFTFLLPVKAKKE